MTLGEIIQKLREYPNDQIVSKGFYSPHSYSGDFKQLAFEPIDNVTVGEMLDDALKALNKIFRGYKGGEFLMHEDTECWLAEYGDLGEEIGPTLLGYMLGDF